MIPEARVYQTANRLIEQHGDNAMKEANRLLSRALERREQERTLIMLRVRTAIAALQAPPRGPLH
jgi:predicted transposase YdaD